MLSRPHRLVSSVDHRAVARRGRRGRSGPVAVSALPGPADTVAKLAVVVPKRVGTSVQRNRVQRQLRHLLRDRLSLLDAGTLAVVRLEPGSYGLSSRELAAHLDTVLDRIRPHAPTRGAISRQERM